MISKETFIKKTKSHKLAKKNKQIIQMEHVDVELGRDINVVQNTVQSLLDCVEENKSFTIQSICMAPSTLRSPSSFDPRVVSIGPLHREDENVQAFEGRKASYVHELLKRVIKHPREVTLRACVEKVDASIEQIRGCYVGLKAYDDTELTKMMVMDACFILEFIYSYTESDEARQVNIFLVIEFLLPVLNSTIHSAVELDRAGVKFKPNRDAKCPTAMNVKLCRFAWFPWSYGKPRNEMPVLRVHHFTELVFRNIIAYEQSSSLGYHYVTSYAIAMDMLIDTQEDVVKLVESKVLVDNMGSNEEAANMMNSICKKVAW
ncbi:putative UPF0481 protein, partial [Tanacetum coccineum]